MMGCCHQMVIKEYESCLENFMWDIAIVLTVTTTAVGLGSANCPTVFFTSWMTDG